MMMLGGDDLNLTKFRQGFGQLVMENWKQAILEHELIFRNQVRELHRLYWTQKNLMNEHHKRTFNLQLPADNYINAVRNDLDNNLSISNVDEAEKETVGVGKEVIVLDDSLDLGSHEGYPKEFQSGGFELLTQKVPAMFESKPTDTNDKSSISMEASNAPCVPSTVHFSEEDDRSLLEQNPHFYHERLDHSFLAPIQNHSRNLKRSTHELIDLNLPYEDEAHHHQNDPDSLTKSSHEKKAGRLFHFGRDIGPVGDNKRQDSNVTVSRDSSIHAMAEDEAQQRLLIGKFSSVGYNSECCSSDEKGAEEPASVSITDDSVITQLNSPEEEDVTTVTAAEILMALSFGSSANAAVQVDRMCC